MAAGGIIADAAFVLNDGRWLHVRVSGDVVDIWREETLVAEAVDRKLFDPQVVVALPDGRGTVAVSIDYAGEISARHDGRSLRCVGQRAETPHELVRPRRWLLALAAVQWLPFLLPVGPFDSVEMLSSAGFAAMLITGIALIPYIAPGFAFFAFGWFGLLHAVGSWIVLTDPEALVGDYLLRGAIAGLLLRGWSVSWRHHRRGVALRRSYEQPQSSTLTSSWWNDA